MKKILAILFFPMILFAFDRFDVADDPFKKGVESFLSIDPFHPTKKSKIDIHSYIMCPSGNSFFMVSPRFSTYMSGDLDMNLGIGFRRPFGNNVLGYHMFYDFSSNKFPVSFHQIGPSIEFLMPLFDLRLNYYHPLDLFKKKNNIIFTTHKWIESEILLKNKYFNIGVGPVYNFSSKVAGLKAKISVPFKYFTISTGTYLAKNPKENSSFFSIGIPIYSDVHKAVGRDSSVKFNTNKIYSSFEGVKKKMIRFHGLHKS